MLKFGIMVMPSAPRGEEFSSRIQECLVQAELAEAAGFDFVTVPEHHQDRGFIPSSLLVAAALAARTSKIRIGTSISLVGLKHPMQMVEDFHSLDAITGGRIIAGTGIGYQPQDFSMFGLDVRDRAALFDDALEVFAIAQKNEVISFEGRHCSVKDVKVMPRPVQPDGIPVWVGAWSKPGVRRAGRVADGLIIDQHTDTERAAELLDLYHESAALSGRPTELTLQRYAAIGDSKDEARAILEPHVMKTLRYYWRQGARDDSPAWNAASDPYELKFEDYERRFVYGSADDITETLTGWQNDIHINNVLLLIRTASAPTHEVVCDQIRRWGDEVIPRFAAAPAPEPAIATAGSRPVPVA